MTSYSGQTQVSTAILHISGNSSVEYCQPRGQGDMTLTNAGPSV